MNSTVNEFLKADIDTEPFISERLEDIWNIKENTIALIPFTTVPGSLKLKSDEDEGFMRFSDELRLLYLRATILSIHRYFPKVVISVCSQEDLSLVHSLNLPVWKYIDLSTKLNGKSRMQLPKESMIYMYKMVMSGKRKPNEWSKIKYMYYSEADQILYARQLPKLYQLMNQFNGSLVLVPHRMHVCYCLCSIVDCSCYPRDHIDVDCPSTEDISKADTISMETVSTVARSSFEG